MAGNANTKPRLHRRGYGTAERACYVDAIESLEEPLRADWSRCSHREFNVGYDFGSKPWAFNQGLSSELLGRMAAIGASLRLTLYPPERAKDR